MITTVISKKFTDDCQYYISQILSYMIIVADTHICKSMKKLNLNKFKPKTKLRDRKKYVKNRKILDKFFTSNHINKMIKCQFIEKILNMH